MICGCILPNDPTVKAAPNAKDFIICPIEHHRTQHVCSSDYQHEVEMDDEFNWKVTIHYPAKVDCTLESFLAEFKSIWPVFNRTWVKFKGKENALFRFYAYIVNNYSINYPNVSELILILMAVASNTGPLERSYSKLAKTCYKDQNRLLVKNLEVLYLLSIHKIKEEHKDEIFSAACDALVTKK